MNVLTIGTFDRLHVGHIELLDECRRRFGTVWVGVNRSAFVERYKGRTPQSLEHRIEMLAALRSVDAVFVNVGDEDARPLIECVRPDVLAIGDDWLDPDHDETRYFAQLGVTRAWMDERGLAVAYIPRTRGVSTTALLA